MCNIENYLKKENILCDIDVADKNGLIKKLSGVVKKNYGINSQTVYDIIMERENHGVTGIGNGVAIPHGRIKDLKEIVLVVATLGTPVDYGSLDGEEVRLVFMLLVPEGNNLVYLKLLSQLSIMCNDKNTRFLMMDAETSDKILEVVRNFD